MTAIHLVVINVLVDYKIFKIAMFVNPTKKILKIAKRIRLNIIHECIDAVYIITNIFKVLTVLTTIVIIASVINLFTFI